MKTVSLMTAAAALLLAGFANAAEIKVLSTQATEEAYKELVPQFEKASGHKVTTVFTGTLDLQKRIAAGEKYDLIIMAGPSIEELIKAGKIVPGSRLDIAKSGVGVAVRKGAPKPDISTVDALKKTLLAAKRSAIPPARAASTSSPCSRSSASPPISSPSSSRPRPACSSAPSSPIARSISASSR